MRVKKAGGKIYGASLTKAEEKALNMEIQRQLAEYDKKHKDEIVSLILWTLHDQFGFGPNRLKKFYDNFDNGIEALVKRYELSLSDDVWLCTHKLNEYGIDLNKWNREASK